MRKYILLLILLLSLQLVTAATVQYGEIKLFVQNRPPIIKTIEILPEEPHYDSILECFTEIDDEDPETVSFEYVWYKNDVLLNEQSSTLSDVTDDDVIKCSVTLTDDLGLEGDTKTAETIILASPIRVRIIKPVLNMAGIEISAKDIKESTSMNAITGMVTGQRETSGITLIFVLGIFMFILVLINAVGLTISIGRKRFKSPKQDYQHA